MDFPNAQVPTSHSVIMSERCSTMELTSRECDMTQIVFKIVLIKVEKTIYVHTQSLKTMNL